jgi:hypothetical protein
MLAERALAVKACVIIGVAVAIAGCGDNLKLAKVTGTVTLDGQPLANARVLFQPKQGRPSLGITDSSGKFELQYTQETMGAVQGEHVVSITTSPVEIADGSKRVKEVVPSRYNSRSTLTVTVDKSHRTHDFALQSK